MLNHSVSSSHTLITEQLYLWRSAVLSLSNNMFFLHWSQAVYFHCQPCLCSASAAVIPVFTKSSSCWELCSVQGHWAVDFSLQGLHSVVWCKENTISFIRGRHNSSKSNHQHDSYKSWSVINNSLLSFSYLSLQFTMFTCLMLINNILYLLFDSFLYSYKLLYLLW